MTRKLWKLKSLLTNGLCTGWAREDELDFVRLNKKNAKLHTEVCLAEEKISNNFLYIFDKLSTAKDLEGWPF